MNVQGAVTLAVKQGHRSYQEDRNFFMRINEERVIGVLMAVMDGHCGDHVAEICHREIGSLFKISSPDQSEDVLRNLVEQLNLKTQYFHEGSTFSAAIVLNDPLKVSVAVLGDSPVVVYDGEGNIWSSPEHNVRSNAGERIAAQQRGGYVFNGYLFGADGNNGLQLSRSLGDSYMGGVLSREPEIFTIYDPHWVLVASDGLFDPNHDVASTLLLKEIRSFAERSATAQDLMEWAERRGLKDNATALVWSVCHRMEACGVLY